MVVVDFGKSLRRKKSKLESDCANREEVADNYRSWWAGPGPLF